MKPIPGYDGYFATASGEIWSTRYGGLKRLKPNPDRYSYLKVNIQSDKITKSRRVHVLVLLTFVGPRPAGYEARHKNGIKADNRLENLCWGTPQENTNDKQDHGAVLKGSACSWARLTERDVECIRLRLAAGARSVDLAKEYRVSPGAISNIKRNKNWRQASA